MSDINEKVETGLNIVDTAIEIAEFFLERGKGWTEASQVRDLDEGLKALYHLAGEYEEVMPTIKFVSTVENIQFSARKALQRNSLHILEYETLPLMEELRYMIYYWCVVYPDKDRIKDFMENEMKAMCSNAYVSQAERTGNYKYDLSISVLAYNNLKFTKLCVESILATMPKNLRCELVLINHGSTDGTQEYFESVGADKIFQLYRNNGNFNVAGRIIEGKYNMAFTNDVIALPHAIENMYRLATENEKAIYIVPSTPNISNLQNIPAEYETLDEMMGFAEKNNIYDKKRHEERVRLCNPVTCSCTKYTLSYEHGIFAGRYQYSSDFTSFGDDKMSLIYRRKGFKNILAKDAYCHHFGSMTIRNEEELQKEDEYYNKGRKYFKEFFGVDPWGKGLCYDPDMIKLLDFNKSGRVNVLGINCGLGSNSLKVREAVKERGNFDAVLYNITDEREYGPDLKGISDYFRYSDKAENFAEVFENVKFDYIVCETDDITETVMENMLKNFAKAGKKDAYLVVGVSFEDKSTAVKKLIDRFKAAEVSGSFKDVKVVDTCEKWLIFNKVQ